MFTKKTVLKGILYSRRPDHLQWKHFQTESDLLGLVQSLGHLAIGSDSSTDCS